MPRQFWDSCMMCRRMLPKRLRRRPRHHRAMIFRRLKEQSENTRLQRFSPLVNPSISRQLTGLKAAPTMRTTSQRANLANKSWNKCGTTLKTRNWPTSAGTKKQSNSLSSGVMLEEGLRLKSRDAKSILTLPRILLKREVSSVLTGSLRILIPGTTQLFKILPLTSRNMVTKLWIRLLYLTRFQKDRRRSSLRPVPDLLSCPAATA